MKILIACEFSGRVRDAFRARGHDAWSCDIQETQADPTWHIQGDALEASRGSWDLMVAFPPCTFLTSSNAKRWDAIAEERETALDFVRQLMAAPIERIAIENPMGAIGTHIRRADQYIHPWHFGDPYQKRTGLWLTNLAPLVPDTLERPEGVEPWCQAGYGARRANGTRQPGGLMRRVSERNKTFPGIARAMAEQWG